MSFFTSEGLEVPAVTAEQMRELDRIAIQETGPNLFQMMENAGRNLALHAIEMLGARWKTANIVVLAGLGGNGGGGICAARHLANRGANVCLAMSDPSGLREVPSYQLEVYRAAEAEAEAVPSGVDATTGEAAGDHIRASATLTLALPKTGLRPEKTGDLYLADIGIPARAFQNLGLQYTPPFSIARTIPGRVGISSTPIRASLSGVPTSQK